jgi:hypothetical protein
MSPVRILAYRECRDWSPKSHETNDEMMPYKRPRSFQRSSIVVISYSMLCKTYENGITKKPTDSKEKMLVAELRGLSPQARTIPTERPPLVGEVSANFSG